MKKSALLLSMLLLLAMVLSACGTDKAEANVKKFLEIELNCPNETIEKLLEADPEDTSMDYEKELRNLYGGFVNDELIPDLFGVKCTDFWGLHVEAYRSEAGFELKSLDISRLNDSNYDFTASITVTNKDGEKLDITIPGSVQVDEKGLVNFARIKNNDWYDDFSEFIGEPVR
ncbi:MAG: hypothetical protein Q4C42_05540 [Clostridia bacterium]|nr:hypothetical protein [Clostridia bacterium]